MRFAAVIVLLVVFALAGCSEDDGSPIAAPSEAVTVPHVPDGPRRIHPLAEGSYTTGGSVSSFGHPLEYAFDFGGFVTEWSPDSVVSHTWGADSRAGMRVRSRCALHNNIVSPWTVNALVIVNALVAADFETPALGLGEESRVLDAYFALNAAVTFTTDNARADIGLVKNRSTAACVGTEEHDQKLGTGLVGTGEIGTTSFRIRADFTPELPPLTTLRVDVQTLYGDDVTLKLFSDSGAEVAVVTEIAEATDVSCHLPGGARSRLTLESTPAQAVKYATVETKTFVFVIDDLEIEVAD